MARHSDRTPTHLGALLREDLLPAMGQSVTDLAARLALPEADLLEVLAERAPVTPELALRLGAVFGNGAAFWNRLQAVHDGRSHPPSGSYRNASPG
ncbi:HigA family addiction module antitoxin [Acetobacter pasteurianus]|uniref:HigA family addiction module antitoxin n=1 Tax=Acetobacter pasteurianus TaxID=438 RepID=UPI0008141A2C|nr:HigA family addiction module antitoxin [Acetobacter pasteurianus]